MAIQQFGNAFKAQINENKRKTDLKAVGTAGNFPAPANEANFFAPGNTGGYNYERPDSTLIDNFYDAVLTGGVDLQAAAAAGTNGDNWSSATIITEIKAAFVAYAGVAAPAGDVAANAAVNPTPGTLVGDAVYTALNGTGVAAADVAAVHGHGGTIGALITLAGIHADATAAIEAGVGVADDISGQKLGRLYNLGWEIADFHRSGNDIAVWNPITGVEELSVATITALNVGGKTALISTVTNGTPIALGAPTPWRTAWCADTAGFAAPVVAGHIGTRNAGARNANDPAANGDGAEADKWLDWRLANPAVRADNLTAQKARVLHTKGWEASDLVVNGNDISAHDPVDGAVLNGYIAIQGVNKLARISTVTNGTPIALGAPTPWRTAWCADTAGFAAPVVAGHIGTRNAGARNANDAAANGDGAEADKWLDWRLANPAVRADNLTAQKARVLHTKGWEASDLVVNGNDIRAHDPVGGAVLNGYIAIQGVNKLARISTVTNGTPIALGAPTPWRTAWCADTAGFAAPVVAGHIGTRNPGARNANDAAANGDGAEADKWLDWRLANPAVRADNLTAQKARVLHTKGWEASDLVVNGNDIRAHDPVDGAELNGYIAIQGVNVIAIKAWKGAFKNVPGASANATAAEIYAYHRKTLTAVQAAALYNASPARIPGSLIENNGRVLANKFGKEYNMTVADDIAELSGKIKAKADAEEEAKLETDKNAAVARIKAKMVNDPEGKPDLKKDEIKTKMNETTPNLISGDNTWETYVRSAIRSNLVTFEENVINAIDEIRKTQQGAPTTLTAARNTAITRIKGEMTKAGKEPITPKQLSDKLAIDNTTKDDYKNLTGDNKTWESYINDATVTDTKIVTARAKNVSEIIKGMWTNQPDKKGTGLTIAQANSAYSNAGLTKPSDTTAKAWTKVVKSTNRLKDEKALQDFLTEIKKFDTTKLKNVFESKELTEKPTGTDADKKRDDLLTNKAPKAIFQTYALYKIKEEKANDFITKIQKEMKEWKKGGDAKQTLEPKDYPKEGDKYTDDAMIKFLCESYEGTTHNAVAPKESPNNDAPKKDAPKWYSTDSTPGKWLWYAGLPLVIVGIVVAIFWTNIMSWWNGSGDAESDDVNE